VNPKGSGAKNVKPSLDCVDTVVNNANGFTYVAHFSWYNPNATVVNVPLGTDNFIATTGSYSGQLPTVFNPGTGQFSILFRGQKMQWNLTTYNGSQKTAQASEASASSGRCSSQQIASFQTSGMQAMANNTDKLTAFPNPTHDRVTLFVGSAKVSLQDIIVIDAAGKVLPTKGFQRASVETVELNLASFANGIYFIKVKTADGAKMFRIVKM